ncbi:hypothetical protein G6F40_013703 [Rhizopus arrhizus]|nr:hypothetical protein G6F40_013703 [Rhizopus arrhizus]
MRSNLGSLADHGDVGVADAPAALAQQAVAVAHELTAVGALPAIITRGEVLADVTQRPRAEHGIAQGMQDHVAVAVREHATAVRYPWPMRTGGNGAVLMDTTLAAGPRGQSAGAAGKYEFEPVQIGRGGDLEVVLAAFHQQRALALALHGHGLVGDLDTGGRSLGQRTAELVATEQLRGQRTPQPFARLGAIDATIVARTLQRVAHRRGQDRADRIGTAHLKQATEIGQRQVRPRGVVDQHELIGAHRLRQRLQPGQHRSGAGRATDAVTR